jgi:ADP-ribosylation factor GTPase-activating protein 1
MDAFKAIEIERMRLGGNEGWRKFYEEHELTDKGSITWDDGTDSDRYTSEVGEEWKERLTAKVEGRDYVPGERKSAPAPVKKQTSFASAGSRSGTPLSGSASRSESPSQKQQSGGKTKVDDEYFARLGNANASRPDHVPPSQGGKYAGFGNTPASDQGSQNAPSFEDMQKDTVAAITKGFGWFTSTVTKTAKTVNDGYLQPASKQVRQLP